MDSIKKFNVLLIGDDCLDVYQHGYVDRISPEAPVPVFVPTYKEEKAGMARNVKLNLESMGIAVTYVHSDTSVKTRLIDSRSKHQIVRVDNDTTSSAPDIKSYNLSNYDAIVISDYLKGTVSYELVEYVIANTDKPIFIDTKKTDLKRFNGAFVKVNESEFHKSQSTNDKLIVTLGERGASYDSKIYPTQPANVVDVCGAGDSFLSALVFGFLHSNSIGKSIMFANLAAGISVQHLGVYVFTPDDICSIEHILK